MESVIQKDLTSVKYPIPLAFNLTYFIFGFKILTKGSQCVNIMGRASVPPQFPQFPHFTEIQSLNENNSHADLWLQLPDIQKHSCMTVVDLHNWIFAACERPCWMSNCGQFRFTCMPMIRIQSYIGLIFWGEDPVAKMGGLGIALRGSPLKVLQ